MKRLTKLSPTLAVVFMLVFMASGMAWADGPVEVEIVQAKDGTPYLEVVDVDIQNHLHAMPIYGFYGFVTNRGRPAYANVATNLVWSGQERTTHDVQSCKRCGYYAVFCNVESGFSLLASLNTTGGHTPLLRNGYRCDDELIQIDFEFDVWAFYAKICDLHPIEEYEVYPVKP